MKRFNSSKVKPSDILTPSCEKAKAAMRRANGVKQRFAVDNETKPYDQADREKRAMARKPAPLRADFVPCKLRGRSGTRLNPAIRAALVIKAGKREAFFEACKPSKI
mgnify:CR=1 FL=1